MAAARTTSAGNAVPHVLNAPQMTRLLVTSRPYLVGQRFTTDTGAPLSPLYFASPLVAVVLTVYGWSPSSTKSSTPVTVTVWGVLQLAGVNVSVAGDTVPSAVLLLLRPMATLAVGWVLRTTVKVAVLPQEAVSRPEVGVTVMPMLSWKSGGRDSCCRFWSRRHCPGSYLR